MGRREKPITTPNRALADLVRWLRHQRAAEGLTYAQLAVRTGLHATTLQRAASATSVPTGPVVEAYARGCGVSVEVALRMWRRARQEHLHGAAGGRMTPAPETVADLPGLSAALWGLYSEAGGPPLRTMEHRAGGYGALPHSTVHRILRGQTVPRDERQLVAFLDACEVPARERRPWVEAWRRVCTRTPQGSDAVPPRGEAAFRGPGEEAPFREPSREGVPFAAEDPFLGAHVTRAQPLPAPRSGPAALAGPPALSGPTPAHGPAPRTSPVPPGAGALRLTVLGPVRVWRGDQPLSLGSPQQKALLAALLLRGGHTATAEELIDAIWGEEPPEQARAALRTYASRIRKALGPDGDLLVSESGGYALREGGGTSLDVETARELAAQADKAASGGDLARACELYDAALAQWSGEPLAHIPGPYAEAQRARLAEWRMSLLELRYDLDLRLGRHAEAVAGLTALAAAHPLRERLRELLMLALYRSGRQAEALAVHADIRRLLADELGVDPAPELAALQQRILEADETLAPPGESGTTQARTPARPAQLPATLPDFTGRDSLVARLGAQLSRADGTVMALAGIGGVGKTALAVHLGHAVADRFPDGQLYVDLQGTGASPADGAAVLGGFLRSLGTDDASLPEGVEERAALFRSLLAGRRVLVLLDNARDAAQVRPLLPGTAGCAALVTSRVRMVDLAGARLVDLDVLGPGEAMALFSRVVGAERVGAEREAAMDVVAACGFLPLALRIAAARLSARRTWTVSVLAAKLADERRRLDELQAGDQAVGATFELGYAHLDAEQARAFRLLGLTEGPDIPLAAAAALLDRPAEEAEDLLEALVDSSLLESAGPGRYRLHNLMRLHARGRAEG
ncbi:helix-turn-helix domain-containing protein [Streptomyces reniochalinae]|uniref:Helix-turn-helix domain-containing protein n=1 Tax=Streptomyces reniochalinae TaxID=2250578 RepID=A0A367EF39_9ACTN|nr:BTAD domain-containing putative transcriptional regulator [Streptomyces reniochalinae]RCG15840.1 helix-turn-helix domain-containing protein [Streptomyces reniochalinae]